MSSASPSPDGSDSPAPVRGGYPPAPRAQTSRGLAAEVVDLHAHGAFSFWEWSPTRETLRTFGILGAESLAEWKNQIHPRDREAFTDFLRRRWTPAPPYLSLDYRLAKGGPGDWVHVRHTLGLVEREGAQFLSGMVEELTSPNLSRTLLERTESEMRDGESRIHRFIEEAMGVVGNLDPAPLLDAIRIALRADSVALVQLDDRFEITAATCSHLDTPTFPIQALRGPLARAFLHNRPGGHTRLLEFELQPGSAEVAFFMVKPLFSGSAVAEGAICAGFRTAPARVAARRYRALLSLVAGFGRDLVGRAHREAQRENLLGELCETRHRANAGSTALTMAREMKDLLGPLSGQLATLDNAFEAGDWTAWKEAWRQVGKTTEAAREWVERLLLLGPRPRRDRAPCEINRATEEIVDMMRLLFESRLEVRPELDPAVGPAQLDEESFRGVLTTLLLDARSAMPNGGVVRISTRRTSVPGEEGEYVAVQVSDQGEPGRAGHFPGSLDPLVFEDSDLAGPAFGLYHVASLLAEHGGRLETSGDLGPGNTLRLLLPAAKRPGDAALLPDPLETLAPLSPENRLAGSTVLLVEDEDAVRQMVRKVLEVLGGTVIEAASGREAPDLWPKLPDRVSVVVCDVALPGETSGWDLARDLHRRHPSLGILLTSGHRQFPEEHGLGQVDRIDFLQKPYPVSALRDKLNRLMERSPA